MAGILLQSAYLGAIGFSFCTCVWLMLKADRNRTTRAFIVCQILIMIWCLPQLFLAFAVTLEIKYVLYGISYMGISFIGPCWLEFSCCYCGKKIPLWARWVLPAIAVFDYIMFWTNGLHHFFYKSFGFDQVVYGPVFYVHMTYAYGCVILGMAAVISSLKQRDSMGIHGAVLILAAALPLVFNMLYLSGAIRAGFDLTPPVFALSSFLMVLAVFRYDFLDINVVASQHIFASIAEGVVIYNRRGRVTCCNEAAGRWLEVKSGDDYDMVRKELHNNQEKENQKVQAKEYPLYDRRGRSMGGVLVLTDVGEYYELLRQSRELAVSEQRLAIEQERNRIAQEVHDTTGHTLTMIQSLIKLIRIHCEEEEKKGKTMEPELMEYLYQAQELASGGIRELRWSINHMKQGDSCELVTQGVYQLAASVKEIDVEVEIQGQDGPEYSHLSAVVYQCLREAITNCLKYAHGSHMDVIVKFAQAEVNVYIFDDGQGCGSIKAHNGLSGMESRVKDAGGRIRFLSAEGEGFQIYLELPVKH